MRHELSDVFAIKLGKNTEKTNEFHIAVGDPVIKGGV
jgi:hypothetical protein